MDSIAEEAEWLREANSRKSCKNGGSPSSRWFAD